MNTNPAHIPLRSYPNDSGPESSLAELAERFAARVADPELAADLALQIVLNEIAEQACLTTGASGAAIALKRDGELVCRASSGSTAPELGATVNAKQGLSAECVRTRQAQVCEDIQNDPRTDPTASRVLGARSVMMLPLMRSGQVVGILEAFWSSPTAFREQDRRMLETLARRVIHNVEQASEWSPATPVQGTRDASHSEPDPGPRAVERPVTNDPESTDTVDEAAATESWHRTRTMTYIFGAVVVLVAIGLWARIFQRLQSRTEAASHNSVATSVASSKAALTSSSNSIGVPALSTAPSTAASRPASAAGNGRQPSSAPPGKSAAGASLPPGSLAVYDNGREIFRMLPGSGAASVSAGKAASSPVRQAVSIEPDSAQQRSTSGGSLLRRVEPVYPEEARRQGIQGPVVLDIRAGQDGSVQQVRLVNGHPLLAPAAIAAVNQWRFSPYLVNGQSTEIETRVTLDFKLPQ